MPPVSVCAYTARLAVSISDAMLTQRNKMAAALMNWEHTFVPAM